MIMPSKDTLYNGRKGIGFDNPSYFEKAKDLRPGLYDEKVIGLGYTLMFLIYLDEALEIEKFKRARENKIKFAYDYGNLNASYVNEKINFLDDYFQEIINQDFKKIDSPFRQTSSLKPYVLTVILEKIIIDLEDEVVSLLEKEKANLETIESLKSKGFESSENAISKSKNQSENDCQVVEKECDKVENSKVIAPGMFKLNVKRYSRKDLLSCNNSHLGETSSAYDCNDARNVSCNSRLYDSFDENNLFIFDDVSVRNSPVSKMSISKNPRDSMNVRSKNGVDLLTDDRLSNLYTIALNDVASNSLTCLLAKASSSQSWLWHQRLSHLNFATINNLVKNNLVQEFKNKTLAKFFDEVGITQQFSAVRTLQQNDVVERRNQTLVEAARTMLTFTNLPLFLWAEAITTACFTQNRSIIHKRFNKTPYDLMNKRKPNIKFFRVFGCICYLLNDYKDVGKVKEKGDIRVFVGYSKESAAFRIYNKRTRKIHGSVNESSLSSLNDDVQQSSKEVGVPSSNTQSISNNMIPNVDEASTSHNVFNERLEDAYFDASTSFHDPSNVHTFYQSYPHEKKWTKNHSLHKIIGDMKSSVCTRGQLANSCLFSCLLGFIEPANVAEALRDAD
nr:hypothetical protein [Tanacetum cinerariifolium]